jgi:hypothetical protein
MRVLPFSGVPIPPHSLALHGDAAADCWVWGPLLVLYRLGLLPTVLALALVALINLAFARFREILATSTARCRLKQVHRAC